jgi:hypothetical protein
MSFANGPACAAAGVAGRTPVVSLASALSGLLTITLLLTIGSLPLPTLLETFILG